MDAHDGRSGHVIVCGTHGVAVRTVEQLRVAGADVVVLSTGRVDAVAERLLEEWDVPQVAGRTKGALLAAGLAGAVAVVCMPGDDLQALEIALLARQLRPDVRLVVQMGNGAVSRALAELIGDASVLDVPALSAPAMVEACLGRRDHVIELAGTEFVAVELEVDREGTLRELFGELAPLTVNGAPGTPAIICPGRDHPVRPGDRVTAIGTPDQFTGRGAAEIVERIRPQAPVRHAAGARGAGAARAVQRAEDGGGTSLRSLLRSIAREADRPLRTAALMLVLLGLVSVVVLRLGYLKATGERMSIVDAVYFTVETIATVGYGDFSFAEQATWLRVYAIGLMGMGAILMAVVFALLTQLLVSRRVERSFGNRRVGAMRGHVVVVGLGAVGMEVLQSLRQADRRAVAVDTDEDGPLAAKARALGVPVVIGDATDADVLASANVNGAAAVAVLTSDDLTNIETGLVVRDQLGERWTTVPVVLRVFDRELGASLEDAFDFRHVRSTAALAAPWFVGAALGLAVLGTFYVDRTPFLVGRLSVTPGGGLDGLAMGELSEHTRVLAIHRAGDGERTLQHPPRRGTRFGAGDDAYLVGPYEELLGVLRRGAGDQGTRVASASGIEMP
jgi:Trk K+ transport system NAD-binding subunit